MPHIQKRKQLSYRYSYGTASMIFSSCTVHFALRNSYMYIRSIIITIQYNKILEQLKRKKENHNNKPNKVEMRSSYIFT